MATAEKVEARNEKATTIKSVGLLDHTAVKKISGDLRLCLADLFALYLKTKNFHWHMTGKHSATITYCSMSTRIKFSP